jgi:hypothetical protein
LAGLFQKWMVIAHFESSKGEEEGVWDHCVNTYFIEHKIRTLAKLWDKKFTHNGFEFRQWDFTLQDGPIGGTWIARKAIEAQTAIVAINSFRKSLFRLVDRIAFLGQCYTFANVESFVIVRQNDNPTRVFFFQCAEETVGVRLSFDEGEIKSLTQLESYKEKGDVFRYLREAANASSYYTRLVMLISALEAIAGEKTGKKGHKQTDKAYIRDHILKDTKLHDKIFKYGDGIRNRLLHGGKIDLGAAEHRDIDYVDSIYRAIVRYFNENHGTEINTRVVRPLRTPYSNFTVDRAWLKPRQKGYVFDLKTVSEHYAEQYHRSGTAHAALPNHFEVVERPARY